MQKMVRSGGEPLSCVAAVNLTNLIQLAGVGTVWLNLPRSPTRVKAITLQKNRVTGDRRRGHPAFHPCLHLSPSSLPGEDGRRALFAPQLPPPLLFFFLLIAVNDQWLPLKWVGHRGPVYQGQARRAELRAAEGRAVRLSAAIWKWSPPLRPSGYSFCPLSRSLRNLPLLFILFPHSLLLPALYYSYSSFDQRGH